MSMTKEERMAYQRARRAANGNAYTKKYERTKSGKLMRMYRNMQSRIMGIQKAKAHLYVGKELLPREEFYAWAMASNEFHRLYREWVEADYDQKLAPTVDRVDSRLGYSIPNMQWVTHSENSRRSSAPRRKDSAALLGSASRFLQRNVRGAKEKFSLARVA